MSMDICIVASPVYTRDPESDEVKILFKRGEWVWIGHRGKVCFSNAQEADMFKKQFFIMSNEYLLNDQGPKPGHLIPTSNLIQNGKMFYACPEASGTNLWIIRDSSLEIKGREYFELLEVSENAAGQRATIRFDELKILGWNADFAQLVLTRNSGKWEKAAPA